MNDVASLVEVVKDAGVVGLLVAIVVGGLRGWWVPRWTHDEIVKDRDWWRDTAVRSLELGEAAVRRGDDRGARRRYLDDVDAVERRMHDGP